MTQDFARLAALGWSNHFQSQLGGDDAGLAAVRVTNVHRNALEVAGADALHSVLPIAPEDGGPATIGDWLLVDASGRVVRVLERKTVFRRRAAGTGRQAQLIAANVDTLFVVSSCNHDFNIARLERYLALARDAGVTPVVVLTKADLADDVGNYAGRAARLLPGLLVEPLDARSAEEVSVLRPWCALGQTVALVGSSGVGKSTLVNALTGSEQETAAIREDDSRGRHTTTGRTMHRLAAGGWLIDTPGMRELQLVDAEGGIDEVFADVVAIAHTCRFADCQHDREPGCAVRAALESCELAADRFARYRKLAREDRHNSEELHERHARERVFGKHVRDISRLKRERWQT
jgi:ribosome biogenesis GTPase